MFASNSNSPSRQKAPALDWQVCEDERAWEAVQHTLAAPAGDPHATASRAPRSSRRNALAVLGALLVMLSVGWWAWQRGEAGLTQVEAELEAAVVAELWQDDPLAAHAGSSATNTPHRLDLPNDRNEVITEVEMRELGEDWAVVDVTIQLTTDGPSYRQTRVYRADDRGWTRTRASAARWGTMRQLESQHFIFIYQAVDEAAVKQAAPQLDAYYQDLLALFSVTAPPAGKLSITIAPAPEIVAAPAPSAAEITVPSPAALLLPTNIAPHDALLLAMALVLHNRLASDAMRAAADDAYRFRLHKGLHLWFIWQHDLALAKWREPLVQWVLTKPSRGDARGVHDVPAFASELCAHHSWWMASPLDFGVPLVCTQKADGTEHILAWHYDNRATNLAISPPIYAAIYGADEDVGDISAFYKNPPLPEPGPNTIIMATIFEYVTARYGPAMMPPLLARIPEHQSADTLIPAVFGVPLSEFERGWHAFLVERYALELPPAGQ